MGVARLFRGLISLVTSRAGKKIFLMGGFIIIMFFLTQLAFPEVTSKVTIPVPFVSVHYTDEDSPPVQGWTQFLSSTEDEESHLPSPGSSGKSSHASSSSHHHQNHKTNPYYDLNHYNESKVALLIENRPIHFLAPLMLHFMSVIPPDWKFRFMGSRESVEFIQQSFAIRQQVKAGKLDLTYIPSNMTTAGSEAISSFLTNLWVYETLLQPAEWLLVFQTDSMLCANSRQNLDDYLDYDWVGAPWNPYGSFGGNGGLSLRRVSSIIQVLRDQQRIPNSEPEDVWLTDRLGHRPGAKMANGTFSLTFSGEMNSGSSEMLWDDQLKAKAKEAAEAAAKAGKPPPPTPDGNELDDFVIDKENIDINESGHGLGWHANNADADWIDPNDPLAKEKAKNKDLDMTNGAWKQGIDDYRIGHYEPMGYHIGSSGANLHGGIWGRPELRKHIWDYCPEVKIMLQMDAAEYVPGNCHASWKRDVGPEAYGSYGEYGAISMNDFGFGTEWLDGIEYPMLPPGFSGW